MIKRIFKLALLLYLGFGLILFFGQRQFIYFPMDEKPSSNIRNEYIKNDDELIKVSVLGSNPVRAVLYFGGNAEDVVTDAPKFKASLPDHTIYLVNYRGFSGSSGTPTQANLFSDAVSIYDTIKKRHAQVFVIGRSLGSGIAAFLASQRPVSHLALVTPYDSVLSIAQSRYPIYPVSLMLQDTYESIKFAPKSKSPTLILLAESDKIIPHEHSHRLTKAFAIGQTERHIIENSIHNNISNHPDFWRKLARFID